MTPDALRIVEAGKLLFRVGPAPDYLFEWGEDVTPDEAAEVFAREVSQLLRGRETFVLYSDPTVEPIRASFRRALADAARRLAR